MPLDSRFCTGRVELDAHFQRPCLGRPSKMVVGFLNVTELEVCVGELSAHTYRDRIWGGGGMGMHTVCDHSARINLTGSKQV